MKMTAGWTRIPAEGLTQSLFVSSLFLLFYFARPNRALSSLCAFQFFFFPFTSFFLVIRHYCSSLGRPWLFIALLWSPTDHGYTLFHFFLSFFLSFFFTCRLFYFSTLTSFTVTSRLCWNTICKEVLYCKFYLNRPRVLFDGLVAREESVT